MINTDPTLWIAVGTALLASFTGAITVIMLVLLRDRSESRYDKENHRAELSAMRAKYEHDIASINLQLLATEQRWRDANHLLLAAQHAQDVNPPSTIAQTPFFKELGISPQDIVQDPRLIFVLTPFSAEEEPVYRAIKDVCERTSFRCMRGDEEYVAADLLRHIVRLIAKSRFVIANVGSRNPNVFYELGIAQAIGKRTIIVSQTLQDVPFDLQSQQIVVFHDASQLAPRLAESLARIANAPA